MEWFAAPLGELAMSELALTGGERVLDVGCGTGWSTVALGERVGAEGRVAGIDISPSMARRARQNSRGGHNIEIFCGDAGMYPYPDLYDAIFSRFGMMFFDDLEAALSHLRLALRPGGRIGFVSWANVATNDFYMISGLAVLSVTRTPAAQLRGLRREPFALSDPAVVNRLLDSAGFRHIRITQKIVTTSMTEAQLQRQLELSSTVTGLREVLDALAEGDRARAAEAIRRDLWARVRDGRVQLKAGVLVTAARR